MGHPGPEIVAYRSYIRYIDDVTTVIYPSTTANFGLANAGKEYMKVLGQDTTPYA